MKKYITLLLLTIFISSCSSRSRNALGTTKSNNIVVALQYDGKILNTQDREDITKIGDTLIIESKSFSINKLYGKYIGRVPGAKAQGVDVITYHLAVRIK